MIIGLDANEANLEKRVGSNVYAINILCQLYKLDKKNSYQIYLQKPPIKSLPKPTKCWQYQVISNKFFWTQTSLPVNLYLKKPRPDVFLSLGHYAPRFCPMPNVVCIMDLAFLKYPQTYLKKDLYKLKNWTKYSVKKAEHIIAISQTTKNDLVKTYSISKNKITVAYPAITQSKTIKKSPYKNYLLYLGTLQPRKNLNNLIKAYAQLPQKYHKYKLVIAGKKGWLYQSLFKTVSQLDLQKKVIFTGFVKNNQVSSLIKQAKLFILPSLYEGFGIPVLRAMSLNTPVLVSKNSSLKEIVQDAGTYIKPPFESLQIKKGIIKSLSISKTNQPELIKKAYQRSQNFSWKKSAQKILTVLNT